MQGFAIPKEAQDKVAEFSFHGQSAELKHGSVVIAAITSCTNTSNPSVMLGAALVAKKACELGLQVSHGQIYFLRLIPAQSHSFVLRKEVYPFRMVSLY